MKFLLWKKITDKEDVLNYKEEVEQLNIEHKIKLTEWLINEFD